MLYPSIDELLEKVDSKYRLVKIATQRCREIEEKDNPYLNEYISEKNIGKALEEINEGLITYEKE